MKKRIQTKIDKINDMLEAVALADETPTTYDGGTFPYYVQLKAPIRVKNQFVYIPEDKWSMYSYRFEKRYNVNREYGIGSLEELNHHLNVIIKSFKKVIS